MFSVTCRHVLAKENDQIRISLIQKDLSVCQQQLGSQEQVLQDRIVLLEKDAIARKRARDLGGAKKKMVERRMVQSQLDSLRDSMSTIDLHRNTIERSMLNRTVVDSLRAAGDVLRQMGATREGISSIERMVDDVEEQVESASTITKILSAGSVTGTVNSMAINGVVLDEDALMQELEDMLLEEDEAKAVIKDAPAIVPLSAASSQQQHGINPNAASELFPASKIKKIARQPNQQQQFAAREEALMM